MSSRRACPPSPKRTSEGGVRKGVAFFMSEPPLLPGPLATALLILLRASDRELPTFEVLAARLGVHPRSLRRRLQAEGLSYLQLRNAVRAERAIQLLCAEHLTHEQIASRLGLSDGSSFRRAFRAWTGKSPRAYRRSAAT